MGSRIRSVLAILILLAAVAALSGCFGIEAGLNLGPAKIKLKN